MKKILIILVIFISTGCSSTIDFEDLDPHVQESVIREEKIIQECQDKEGIAIIRYRALGFPKKYLERCDFPYK